MMSFKSDHNFPAVGRRHVVVFISLLIKICGDEGNILLPRSLFKQLKLLIWGPVPIAWGGGRDEGEADVHAACR